MSMRLPGPGLWIALALSASCTRGPASPSVLLITLDTTRQDALSCYGAPPGLTPNLDRLAEAGITYLQARTVAPITLPSHASMLTGLWPPRHGLRINGTSRLPAAAETLAELARARGFETAAFLSAAVLGSTYALDQGFDVYDEVDVRVTEASNSFPRRDARETIDAALAWFRARGGERPFFCWVHLFDPHGPWPDRPLFLPVAQGSPYLAQVAYMDREIGRLLDEPGVLDDTLVLVVGDHGESLGDRGEFAHGVNCYDPAILVPFLVRHPDGRRAGERSNENVSVVDVFATVGEAIDAPAASGDGRSLLGARVPEERGVYFESLYGYANFGWSPLVGWVQDGRKYMHSPQPELYELASDPGEADNAAARVNTAPWLEALREVEALPRLAADAPGAETEELLASLAALGYATGGQVEEAPDPLAPSDLPSPHAAREEYALVQEAFELFDEPERAVRAWRAILERNPRNRTARTEYAYQLTRLERWEEAAESYRQLVEDGSTRSMHWVALGVCTEQLGDLEAAILHYRRGLELDPHNPAARDQYLRAMREAGREAEALGVLEGAGGG